MNSVANSEAQETNMVYKKTSLADCEDVLMKILQRLPVKSFFRFKLVSKKWNQIISDDPSFHFSYLSRTNRQSSYHHLPLLGFFHDLPDNRDNSILNPKILFISASDEYESKVTIMMNKFLQQEEMGYLIDSSNGLLLCGRNHSAHYCICNPITRQCYRLPKPHRSCYYNLTTGGLHYQVEEDSYIVVLVTVDRNSNSCRLGTVVHLETFSSKTCKWTESTLNCHGKERYLYRDNPRAAFGGVFYWFCKEVVLAYDTNQIQHPRHPLSFQLPGSVLGEFSDGRPQCAGFTSLHDELGTCTTTFQVWVLKEKLSYYYDIDEEKLSYYYDFDGKSHIAKSEWVLRYTVSYEKLILDAFPEMTDSEFAYYVDNTYSEPHCPVVLAFHPQNWQLVCLQLLTKLMIYDLGTERLELVQCREARDPDFIYFRSFPYFQPPWPFSPYPRRAKQARPIKLH